MLHFDLLLLGHVVYLFCPLLSLLVHRLLVLLFLSLYLVDPPLRRFVPGVDLGQELGLLLLFFFEYLLHGFLVACGVNSFQFVVGVLASGPGCFGQCPFLHQKSLFLLHFLEPLQLLPVLLLPLEPRTFHLVHLELLSLDVLTRPLHLLQLLLDLPLLPFSGKLEPLLVLAIVL